MPPIGIYAEQQNHSVTFSLPNCFTDSNYDQLVSVVDPFLETYKRFIIDLSQTDFIDSEGLGCFLIIKEKVEDNDAEVILLNPQGQVLKLLERAKFSKLMQIDFSEMTYDI